jgi:hypothetical protein
MGPSHWDRAMPDEGPTDQRLEHAGGFLHQVGRGKATRFSMLDDALGRAWMRHKISDAEYYALKRYAAHWRAGGLDGHVGSLDLDRILAHDPAAMSGLAKTERQQDHRDAYRAAKIEIGRRPAFVADAVACAGLTLAQTGAMLGYQSAAHGRLAAGEVLADAGHRLGQFWKERDR